MINDEELNLRVPTHGRCYIIVQPDEWPEKDGSLFIPEEYRDTKDKTWWWGTVVEHAPGHYNEQGRFVPADVKKGDRVFYDRNTGAEGDPLGYYGVTVIPEEGIVIKEIPDEQFDETMDAEVEVG